MKCEDRCKEIGKEWRKQDDARQRSIGKARKKRKELVKEADKLKREVQDRIKTIGAEIEASELKVKQLETDLAEVERRERGKVVRGTGAKTGGKLSVLVGLAKARTEELRDNLVSKVITLIPVVLDSYL